MLYDDAQHLFGWPSRAEVFPCDDGNDDAYVQAVRKKMRAVLARECGQVVVNVGLLQETADPGSTAASLAILCEFPMGASLATLEKAHSLAWNFTRSALLVILEPQRISAWSCRIEPTRPVSDKRIIEADSDSTVPQAQDSLRDILHWVNLVNGRVLREQPERFPSSGRADALLLKNLKFARRQLIHEHGLDPNLCHDLLARVIFTQFLFDRKDSQGKSFFSDTRIKQLQKRGVLQTKDSNTLAGILRSKPDTYRLFRWLNARFNGDLFPRKDQPDRQSSSEGWQKEEDWVTQDHLDLLADLISGKLQITDQQMNLWPCYSFDVIPLEFISSVYEEFLGENRDDLSAHYTPAYLVDYVLDACLPWNADDWKMRVLDPCCGSGIFLVKAFQRLAHRWKRSHPQRAPRSSDLRPILQDCLVGVDKDANAIRVASFSLYLAMADAIDPKRYIAVGKKKFFPRLRGENLKVADFFDETSTGLPTVDHVCSFDVVVGNAPWRDGSIKQKPDAEAAAENQLITRPVSTKAISPAQSWAKEHKWPVANNDIGPVFFGKALALTKPSGTTSLVNTASILTWRDSPGVALREKLFSDYTVDEITNFSAVRHELFANADGPALLLVLRPVIPKAETTFPYVCPQSLYANSSSRPFIIEPHHVHHVTHQEAVAEPYVWSVLGRGGKRDLSFHRRLRRWPSIAELKRRGEVITRVGVIPGNKKQELDAKYAVLPYLESHQFPEGTFLELDASKVAPWGQPRVADSDSNDFAAFKSPQVLIKQTISMRAEIPRMRAAVVSRGIDDWGVICKKTYLSVRDLTADARHHQRICITYNSLVTAYLLSLASSRGFYRTELLSEEIESMPLAEISTSISEVRDFNTVDDLVCSAFQISPAERILIDDYLGYILPDTVRKTPGLARERTARTFSQRSPLEIEGYADIMLKVLKAGLGDDLPLGITIYEEIGAPLLPVRVITLHLDRETSEPVINTTSMGSNGLLEEITRFHEQAMLDRPRGFQRVASLWHTSQEGGRTRRHLTLIKPDERRYWLRSVAMRDADDLVAAARSKARQTTRPA